MINKREGDGDGERETESEKECVCVCVRAHAYVCMCAWPLFLQKLKLHLWKSSQHTLIITHMTIQLSTKAQ